jgi:hypothetical protein
VEDLLPGQALSDEVVVEGVWPLVRLDVEARFVPTGSVGQTLDGLTMDDPSASASVWALPWLLVVVVVAGVGSIVLRWLRRRERSSQPKA